MLKAESLGVRYGPIAALADASLEVQPGEWVAVIGANGAGKSSLLNALSGIVRPAAGRVLLDGVELSRRPAWQVSRAGLLQVPEGRQILGPLSVLENLQLGALAAHGRPGPAAGAALERVFELFPVLAERRHQPGGALSGGQQQMLAIGRALMGQPRVLLLDEPSLGLAPKVVTQVFEALRRLNRDGLALLLVEQNARLALAASHRALVLEHGRITLSGPSAQLRSDPRVIEHYLGVPAPDEPALSPGEMP